MAEQTIIGTDEAGFVADGQQLATKAAYPMNAVGDYVAYAWSTEDDFEMLTEDDQVLLCEDY
ncbi:hypothetical protein [Hymenobacter fodinae]|uniref:Uncharacterized protein n=1 Tax=Hymenobacter fodinae TaxID=2510796 RepID=A0A4Z0P8Q3_9BACT|nr:hypothetical protein [Hymenobacter fodinae]TGE08743.1 hypothetical protein EU556_13740 [Hymenobacter fodinae]